MLRCVVNADAFHRATIILLVKCKTGDNLTSGITERLGALGHIDILLGALHYEPCHISVGLNTRPKGLRAVLHSIS